MDWPPAPNQRARRRVPAHSSQSINLQTTSTTTPKVTICSDNDPAPTSSSRGTGMKRKADEAKTPNKASSDAATGQQVNWAPCKIMSPAALKTLLTAAPPNNCEVTNRQYILIDTRDSVNFNKCRVKANNVARFPINPDAGVQSQVLRIPIKGGLVKYLLETKADMLDVLQAPGFYNYIVVLSELGIGQSWKLHFLMLALAKWNENTRTAVCILEGGVLAFCNQYHQHAVFGMIAPPVVAPATGSTTTTNPCPEDCLKHLDAMIVTSTVLVKLASKLKSLSSALFILRESELEIRKGRIISFKGITCPACK